MAVSDHMIIIVTTMIANYLFLWKQGWGRRILADILFIVIGFATHYVVSVSEYPWGILLVVIATTDLLYQVANP